MGCLMSAMNKPIQCVESIFFSHNMESNMLIKLFLILRIGLDNVCYAIVIYLLKTYFLIAFMCTIYVFTVIPWNSIIQFKNRNVIQFKRADFIYILKWLHFQ